MTLAEPEVPAQTTTVEPDGPPEHGPPTRRPWLAYVALVGLALALVAVSWTRITGPFGDSHDGRNAAVWASGSRALREDGPVGSRLGAVHQDGTVYANHPPLIVWAIAVSEAALGERSTSTRLPIVLSSLTAVLLLYLVGRATGFRPLASALGAGVALFAPMVVAYGAMPDTPMLSLGFGLAGLLVWQRGWHGRATRPWLAGVTGLAAALSGWEAAALVTLAAASLWVAGIAHREAVQRRVGASLLVGTLAGVATTFAWATWAYGAPAVLLDQFTRRSTGTGGATFGMAVYNQVNWLGDLLGPAAIGLCLAVLAAVLDVRVRPLFLLLLGTTLGYTVLLWNGAVFHDYWNYWMVVPAGLGAAWAANALLASGTMRDRPAVSAVVILAAIVAIASFGMVHRSEAAIALDDGQLPALLFESSADGLQGGAVADIGPTQEWLPYASRLPYTHLNNLAELDELARTNPRAAVLVHQPCVAGVRGDLCRRAWEALDEDAPDGSSRWRIARAEPLRRALDT